MIKCLTGCQSNKKQKTTSKEQLLVHLGALHITMHHLGPHFSSSTKPLFYFHSALCQCHTSCSKLPLLNLSKHLKGRFEGMCLCVGISHTFESEMEIWKDNRIRAPRTLGTVEVSFGPLSEHFLKKLSVIGLFGYWRLTCKILLCTSSVIWLLSYLVILILA